MSDRPPADQHVRQRVIEELDTSFFLEAGAGSGKTSVIVERVVNLVRRGRPLSQIVAITFTEKAAAELRERIRRELARAGLADALRDVDAARISTIHAFAAHILHDHALDAGLDPNFRVLDQLQADLRFTQSWTSWLWAGADSSLPAMSDQTLAALEFALEQGVTLSDLQTAAEQIARHRDLAPAQAVQSTDSGDAPPPGEHELALNAIRDALREFVDADAARRRREGVLTYDDLLLEARDLLVRSPSARRALRQRYRAILIDEFQDTDPLQAEIALLLAAEPDTDDWTQATPGPGRLVLAGDPKQSIYRFRRADIDIYEQVRELFREAGDSADVVGLDVNFRARPRLIAWQNRVLEGVLRHDDSYPRAQARWRATVPHRSEPGVGVAAIPSSTDYDKVGDARTAEARVIADVITRMVRHPESLGQRPDDQLGRLPTGAPGYRDVAILVRTRTAADLYTNALDAAQIPWHFDSGQGFYQLPEIRAVTHLLRALDDPSDEVTVAAVLKSVLVACSDLELLNLRRTLGDRRLTLDAAADALPERGILPELVSLRREVSGLGLPELIERVLDASGLLLAQAASSRPEQMRQRQANLRMLIQRAAQFADNEHDSLRPFVRWLSQRGVRNLPESESASTEADDDAVRILTIHQAKGLEFPIVIVPKLQDRTPGGSHFIVDRANRRLEFRLGDERPRGGHAPFRTPGYAAAVVREAAYADAESRRMLYVVATRARDWLILPSFPADSMRSHESFHSYLDEAAPHWLTRDADPDAMVVRTKSFDAAPQGRPELQLPPLDELRRQWREAHATALDGGSRGIVTQSPSQLHRPGPDAAADVGVDESERENGVAGMEFGRAVHEALEAADLADWDATERRTRRICIAHQLPPEPILAHVERAWQSPLLRRAADAESRHRELPLSRIVEESAEERGRTTITEGVADLVFEEAGRWVLVDYKSDEPLPDERLPAYHEEQVRLYASMLSDAGASVAEAYILRTATGEALPVPLEEPA